MKYFTMPLDFQLYRGIIQRTPYINKVHRAGSIREDSRARTRAYLFITVTCLWRHKKIKIENTFTVPIIKVDWAKKRRCSSINVREFM